MARPLIPTPPDAPLDDFGQRTSGQHVSAETPAACIGALTNRQHVSAETSVHTSGCIGALVTRQHVSAEMQRAVAASVSAATVSDAWVGDASVGDTKVGDTKVGDTKVGDTKVGDASSVTSADNPASPDVPAAFDAPASVGAIAKFGEPREFGKTSFRRRARVIGLALVAPSTMGAIAKVGAPMDLARASFRRRARAIGLTLVAAMLCVNIAAPAHADTPARGGDAVDAADIDAFIVRGKKLFDDQEYAGAIQVLAPVTRDARATRAQRLRALELIALCHYIRNDLGAARATFERILDIDPGYQLRDTTGSPKIRAFFDDLKKQLVPGYDPTAGADLEHAAPTAGSAGKPIELEVRATRGGERVFEIVVGTRRRGELAYKILAASPLGGARWRARVVPEPAQKSYVLEYYVEARDAGGAPVARIAGPETPLEIALGPGGADAKRPWYGRWYVIAGAAVAAAGVTGLVIAGTRGPDTGTLPPGSVTLTPK